MPLTYTFKSEVWEYPGHAAWHFASVPKQHYDELKDISKSLDKGFGSIKVRVVMGGSTWETSIFPDNQSQTFLLPLKKIVRQKENIAAGDSVKITLSLNT